MNVWVKKKYDFLVNLNSILKSHNSISGVFVANGRRYHGKIYCFEQEHESNIYVGSSNFSTSGIKANIECTIF